MKILQYTLAGTLMALSPLLLQAQSVKQNFDLGWQFSENNGSWQQVDLPHDWDIHHAPHSLSPKTLRQGCPVVQESGTKVSSAISVG